MAKRDRTVDLQNAMSDTRTTRQGLRRIPIFQAFNCVRASEWTSGVLIAMLASLDPPSRVRDQNTDIRRPFQANGLNAIPMLCYGINN